VEILTGLGLDVVVEEDQGTLVAFRVDGDPKDVVAHAYERSVVIREIPHTGLLRASCGYWTSDDDLARLADVVAPG
jgi:selenocysteine lyase/cysteine desulfurase